MFFYLKKVKKSSRLFSKSNKKLSIKDVKARLLNSSSV